jgi:hypothetical protein
MKKCPSCEKTFDDSMRFCQVDGTPLVDDVPAFDPYATIVAPPTPKPEPPTPAEEPIPEPEEVIEEVAFEKATTDPGIHESVSAKPIAEPAEVLDLPPVDPLKTMFVSEAELQAALGGDSGRSEPETEEKPSSADVPEPPSFLATETPSAAFAPPPSPFSGLEGGTEKPPEKMPWDNDPEPVRDFPKVDEPTSFEESATLIQTSFPDEPAVSFGAPDLEPAPAAESPSTPPFLTPEPPAASSPVFDPPPAPVAEWTPPAAPDASWQNKEIGSNTPFQPPPASASGPSSTLAIISLVLGILGFLSAFGMIIPFVGYCFFAIVLLLGIGAIVTGFLGRSRATKSPDEYGGKGFATAGIILGVLDVIAPFALIALFFLIFGGLSAIGNLTR